MRALWIGLLVLLVAAAAFGPRLAASRPAAQDHLVILSPHWDGIREEFERAFREQWRKETGREVELVWWDVGGGGSEIRRYILEEGRKAKWTAGEGIGVDLLFGGGVFDFRKLMDGPRLAKEGIDAPQGLLEPFPLPPEIAAEIPAEVNGQPLRDKGNHWHAACMSSFGIVYNRLVIERAGLPAPQEWSDLARSEFNRWVSCGDPTRSGSVHMAFEIVLQAYTAAAQDKRAGWEKGWGTLVRLAANVTAFNEGGGSVPRDVSLGQAAAGPCIDFYAAAPVRRQGATHLVYVFPRGLSVVTPDGIALLRNAPNRDVALAFMRFVLSEPGQRLWYQKRGTPGGPQQFDLERLPVWPKLYNEGLPTYTVARPFEQGNAFAYDDRTAGVRWEMLEHVLRATILDVHKDLRDAWAAVIRAGRVDDLGVALGKPPFPESRLMALAKEQPPPVRVNALRTIWTGWARERYQAIRRAAEGGGPVPAYAAAGEP